MKKFLLISIFLFNLIGFSQNEYYEIRKYELPFNSPEAVLHKYFSKVLIPALNRYGVKDIGVFETLGDPIPKEIYLFIPYKDVTHYGNILKELSRDKPYLDGRKFYDSVPQSKKVYNRYNVSFLTAINGLPKLIKPKQESNIFELRIYEGYSEDAVRRKIEMFNNEELKIFDDTGLYSVFFGEQVSGPLMPALTYMLAFESMDERNTNWKKFSADPNWKRISKLDKYSNTVSDIKRTFLIPLGYSQL